MFNYADRYKFRTRDKKENNPEDKLFNSIDDLAIQHYPIEMVNDNDEDRYDINETKRMAFIDGAITILKIFLQK
jgi:hypothetical protein